MDTAEMDSKQEEVVQPQENSAPEAPAEAEAKPSHDDQEKNWREVRRAKDQAERERDELLRRLQDIEAKSQPAKEEEEEDVSLAPDDLVEWRHVEKKIKKLEKELKSFQESSSVSSAESRLKAQYPDFDKVVNKENIELLKQTEPEMANLLLQGKDLYGKGVSAYKMLKNLGIYKEDHYAKDREKAEQNSKLPRSTSSVGVQSGDSPISKANAFAEGLTPDLKKSLWKEMEMYRKKSR